MSGSRTEPFARAWRVCSLLLVVPLSLLLFPAVLTNLVSPAILLQSPKASHFVVSFILFAAGLSMGAVFAFAWSWVLTGHAVHIHSRRRRKIFFLLLCAGNIVLYYYSGVLFIRSAWYALLTLAGAGVLSYSLISLYRDPRERPLG